jgi:hypothetical protein
MCASEAESVLLRARVADLEEVNAGLLARVTDLEELVRHCWVHSGYQDCGSAKMTTGQREMYQSVIAADVE